MEPDSLWPLANEVGGLLIAVLIMVVPLLTLLLL
jgi:sorbitol-specific phosphotransferase system component IIBC